MSKLCASVKVDDGSRIEALKGILLGYLLAQQSILEHIAKHTETAIHAVKRINSVQDVQTFITESDLLLSLPPRPSESTTQQPSRKSTSGPEGKIQPQNQNISGLTIFDVAPPSRDPKSVDRLYHVEVEKEGTISRPGKFVKTNWKDVYAAVSKTGFFHYFTDRSRLDPICTIHLPDCTVSLAPQIDKCALEITVPNSSYFSLTGNPTQYHFRCASEESLVDWMVALRKYVAPK